MDLNKDTFLKNKKEILRPKLILKDMDLNKDTFLKNKKEILRQKLILQDKAELLRTKIEGNYIKEMKFVTLIYSCLIDRTKMAINKHIIKKYSKNINLFANQPLYYAKSVINNLDDLDYYERGFLAEDISKTKMHDNSKIASIDVICPWILKIDHWDKESKKKRFEVSIEITQWKPFLVHNRKNQDTPDQVYISNFSELFKNDDCKNWDKVELDINRKSVIKNISILDDVLNSSDKFDKKIGEMYDEFKNLKKSLNKSNRGVEIYRDIPINPYKL